MARWMGGGATPWDIATRPQWLRWGEVGMAAESQAREELAEQRRAFGK